MEQAGVAASPPTVIAKAVQPPLLKAQAVVAQDLMAVMIVLLS